jgi:endoglucanase
MIHERQQPFAENKIDSTGANATQNSPGAAPRSISRRGALKSLTGAAAAGAASVLASALGGKRGLARSAPATSPNAPASPVKNPAWFGFNLLEYFSTDPDWMKYFPYKNDGMFLEDDFRWIRDWGFNFVRLPMDYRFWTAGKDLMTIDEKQIASIDRAIRLGEDYGIHVNLCLHRAPGECILDGMDESLTGIHITEEKSSVYEDERMLDAFTHQWAYFAQRYRSISAEQLSFNLVNEPLYRPTPAGQAKLKSHRPDDFSTLDPQQWKERQYVRVAREAVEAIRAQDSQRPIVTDGYPGAGSPVPELFDTGIMQNCHTYIPAVLTHYQCEWARGFVPREAPLPTWPIKDAQGRLYDRAALASIFQPWAELPPHGIPIHFGEMGAYKHTPPEVVLAWFDDTLSVLNDLHTGWALWNFRGPFGVLDTERPGTKFEDWHGHQLDRPLLNLLQKRMKI